MGQDDAKKNLGQNPTAVVPTPMNSATSAPAMGTPVAPATDASMPETPVVTGEAPVSAPIVHMATEPVAPVTPTTEVATPTEGQTGMSAVTGEAVKTEEEPGDSTGGTGILPPQGK